MKRTLKLVSAVAAVLSGHPVLGLELGALHTESALNQPFSGRIELADVKPEELDTVRIELASPEDFEKAKIERYYYLTQLRFTPEATADGRVQVRVTSREPMREPYLDFLVQAVWPSGRLIKSYTVLLDPPSQVERRAPSVQTARAIAVTTAGKPPARGPTQTSTASGYLPPPGEGFPVYIGPVAPGDGLWSLARRHAPAGATAAQTALAIYRCNQGAFVRGNINRLVAGKTLVIPSRDELFALDAETAWREFQAAIKGRSTQRSPLTPVTPEMLARLKVVGTTAPTPGGASPGQPPLPTSTAGAAQPSADVLQAIETSEAARQEATEMRQRIQELETQLAEIQGQLKRRDDELARLQVAAQQPAAGPASPAISLPETQPSKPEVSIATPAPETSAGPTEGVAQPGTLGTTSPAQPVPIPPVEPAATAPAGGEAKTPAPVTGAIPLPEVEPKRPEPTAVQPPTAPSPTTAPPPKTAPEPPPAPPASSTWHDLLLPVAGLAGLTALGMLLFSLLSARRRQAQIEKEEEGLSLDQAPAGQAEPPSVGEPAAPVSLAKETPSSAAPSQPASSSSTAPSLPQLEEEEEGPPSVLTDLDIHTDEADVLSEADIYIAYGRHREARDLLEKEIRRHPQQIELKYKLADALAASGDRDALQALLVDIQAAGGDKKDPAQWERIQRLWREATPTITTQDLAARAGLAKVPPKAAAPSPVVQTVEQPSVSASSQPTSETEELLIDLSESLGAGPSESKPDEALLEAIQTPASQPKPTASTSSELPSLEEELDQLLPLIESGQGIDLKLSDIEKGTSGAPKPTPKPAEEPSLTIDSALGAERESIPSDLVSSQWQVDSGIWDEVATKLDLARAYIEMNDKEAAREILEEVLNEGREDQRKEAQSLLERLTRSG